MQMASSSIFLMVVMVSAVAMVTCHRTNIAHGHDVLLTDGDDDTTSPDLAEPGRLDHEHKDHLDRKSEHGKDSEFSETTRRCFLACGDHKSRCYLHASFEQGQTVSVIMARRKLCDNTMHACRHECIRRVSNHHT